MVAGAELEFRLGLKTWSGRFLVTDLWSKGAIGGWKLTERSLARLEDETILDLGGLFAEHQLRGRTDHQEAADHSLQETPSIRVVRRLLVIRRP